jgi:hypothetical protein
MGFSLLFLAACNKEKPPKVDTREVTEITEQSAKCGGNVTSIGSSGITSRGVCWNTSGNPTTADAFTFDGADVGDYASFLNSLQPNTTYYVRAYAKNVFGMAYGKEKSFKTLPAVIYPRAAVIGYYYGQDTVQYVTPPQATPTTSQISFSITTEGTVKDTIYLSSFGPQNSTLLAYWDGAKWVLPNQTQSQTGFDGFSIITRANYFYAGGYIDNGPSRLYYSFFGNK